MHGRIFCSFQNKKGKTIRSNKNINIFIINKNISCIIILKMKRNNKHIPKMNIEEGREYHHGMNVFLDQYYLRYDNCLGLRTCALRRITFD